MKKNIFKKFRLMALLTSLALLLWGGVTACSNGSDDDGDDKDTTSIKLKGAFFEEGDDNTPWEYCSEELKETTESGVWEGEITSVNSGGWDKFGLEINGTWYGAEDGIAEIKDAKLVKDSGKNFWLATKKGGKTKVTVNLNKMTITAVDASQTSDTTTPPPTADDDDDNEEEKPSVVITSIKLNGAFNEDNDDWTDCSEQLKETESNVWEAEITAIKAWGKFKVVITEDGTDIWYGIKSDVTTPITNASLVKDDAVDIWLATEKDGKSKVTVNLNTMTITVAALSES